jgi:hypothetical protein
MKLTLPHRLLWLGVVTTISILGVRAPAMVVDSRLVTGRGWTLAPTGPCCQTGQQLFGLAFHDDADRWLLVGVSFLLQERRRC